MNGDEVMSIAELESELRSLGISRGVRRAAVADAEAITRAFVADGYSADQVRYSAKICECCGFINVMTACVGVRRGRMH